MNEKKAISSGFIMLMLAFCLLSPIGDAVAKILGQTVPIGQLVMVLFAVQALLLIPLVWATGRAWRMSRRVTWLTLLRTCLHILGIGTMVTALKFLPLADAIAIAQLGHRVLRRLSEGPVPSFTLATLSTGLDETDDRDLDHIRT